MPPTTRLNSPKASTSTAANRREVFFFFFNKKTHICKISFAFMRSLIRFQLLLLQY